MELDDVGTFFSRWSRRKLGKDEPKADAAPTTKPADSAAQTSLQPALQPSPEPASHSSSLSEPGPESMEPSYPPLQPVESLTPDSDFKPFMNAGVDPGVKQAALKQLFKDPHFNVMDGLDTYIEDYSIPDPIPDEMMKKLYQAREHLFSAEEKAAAKLEDQLEDQLPAAQAPSDAESIGEVPEEYRSVDAHPQIAPEPDKKA